MGSVISGPAHQCRHPLSPLQVKLKQSSPYQKIKSQRIQFQMMNLMLMPTTQIGLMMKPLVAPLPVLLKLPRVGST